MNSVIKEIGPEGPASSVANVASTLVNARLQARSLHGFPGPLFNDLSMAYACQDSAIAQWPDQIVGWKIGYISPDRREPDGDDRVTGPIFSRNLWIDVPGVSTAIPIFVDGFAAVEAEYVVRLGADAPPEQLLWSAEQAAELVGAVYIGVETAGSPMAEINQLGPSAVVADFGNNAGLILGRQIPNWAEQADSAMQCECMIDGISVGRGGLDRIPGGLLGALAFALGRCARRGLPMRAGMLITTGAATGIHDIRVGQHARLQFGPWGEIRCHAVAAKPSSFSIVKLSP